MYPSRYRDIQLQRCENVYFSILTQVLRSFIFALSEHDRSPDILYRESTID